MQKPGGPAMLSRIFAAAVFTLLTMAGPTHAATVRLEDYIDLNYLPGNPKFAAGGEFTGDIAFLQVGPLGFGLAPPGSWIGGGSLQRNGFPITSFAASLICAPPIACAEYFVPAGPIDSGEFIITVNSNHFPNLTYADFGADSGTVTIVSETGFSPVPLPAALPLFGSGVLALAGVACRKRGKISLELESARSRQQLAQSAGRYEM
jgi:hypothetical protein